MVLVVPATTALALLEATGNLAEAPPAGLPDPGPVTKWGLPISRAVRDVASAVALGALALAAVGLPAKDSGFLTAPQKRLASLAAAAGSIWASAALASFALGYSELSGQGPFEASSAQLQFFANDVELGGYLGWNLLLAGAVAFTAFVSRTVTGLAIGCILATAGLWSVALTGHAAGDANHDLAVNAQALHLVGIGLWMGGLAALLWIHRREDLDLPVVSARYSRVAGGCFAAVAVSGLAASLVRLPSLGDVASTYGGVLGLKVGVVAVLGLLGWRHRRHLLRDGTARDDPGRWFARLATGELVLMAAAAGAGVALSRIPPPRATEVAVPTAGEAVLGRPLPPPLGLSDWLTQWQVDTFWTPVAAAAAVAYLLGARRLRQRGDRWAVWRTVAWLIGCSALVWATSGAPGTYGDVLFSMHVVQFTLLSLTVPTFLVLGAPATLALGALRRRYDGSRGTREWTASVVYSLPAQLLSHPVVAAGVLLGGLLGLHLSSLFEDSLDGHTTHLVATGLLLVAGYLFANAICGIDPGLRPYGPLGRILVTTAVLAAHLVFFAVLMTSSDVLAEDWFSSLGRDWGPTPAADQQRGARIGSVLAGLALAALATACVWSYNRGPRGVGTPSSSAE